MDDEDYLFLPAPRIDRKFKKLIRVGILFISVGFLAMLCAFLILKAQGVYSREAAGIDQLVPFLLFIIPGYGLMLSRQAFDERRAYFRAAMNGIMFDDEGIKGPIAFLEGPIRDQLRDKIKAPVFKVLWENIDQFIVEPRRGKRGDAPPYYKITIKGGHGNMHDSYFILRDYFKGREDQIIAYVKRNLGEERIVLNDELVVD